MSTVSTTYAGSEEISNQTSPLTRSTACEHVKQYQVSQDVAKKVEIEASKVFQWGKGPETSKMLLQNLSNNDIKRYKDQGLILEQVVRWQRFYETELRRNPCDASAPFRAAFLKKLIQLWSYN